MSVFPGALPAAGTASPTATLAAAGHTALHNLVSDEIRAVATKIGTGSSTPASGLVLTGTGAGTSAWSQVNLTTMVSGVLPQANGGTGTTASTGTGSAVYATSPTIITPTIADFTNAQHSHASTSQGGTLNGANAIQSGTITPTQIADRTRSINLPISADGTNPTMFNHAGAIVRFAAAAGAFGRAYGRVPLDYAGGDVVFRFLWASDTVQTRDLNYYQNAIDNGGNVTTIWSISNQTATSGLVIGSANILKETTLTYLDATVSAGTHVAVAIRPVSGTGNIDLYAVTMEYTADS